MTQKSPSKQFLLHPIENHRNLSQLTKDSITDFILIQNNTEEIQLDRAIDTNTSYYAEQLARTIDQGNDEEDLQVESSEYYWKLMTERRQQAIEETNNENQQLHTLINDLSEENDKLRVIANHFDNLQNILETLNAENNNVLDEINTDDSPID